MPLCNKEEKGAFTLFFFIFLKTKEGHQLYLHFDTCSTSGLPTRSTMNERIKKEDVTPRLKKSKMMEP